MPSQLDADVIVVGAGIVGLATARALATARPGIEVLLVEKEDRVGAHQSGHNSGVVHSGVYYRPGSLKAATVASGRAELLAFCAQHGLEVRTPGKVVVATRAEELARLDELSRRAAANGIGARLLTSQELRELEPHAGGIAALHVPSAAIVDFKAVSAALAAEHRARGGDLALSTAVTSIRREGSGVAVVTSGSTLRARASVNCGGLHSDAIARASGSTIGTRIVAFRGEYYELTPEARRLVRGLIYPVPDARFPFLGVHLTPMIDGSVHAGPNAVLALAREGYGWRQVDPRELVTLARSKPLRRLARAHWRTGLGEVHRSLSRKAFLQALRRLLPELGPSDLVRSGAGVRAQALAPDGTLVDDFAIERDGPVVHVLNAPSPAATASLAIGRHIAELIELD